MDGNIIVDGRELEQAHGRTNAHARGPTSPFTILEI